MHIYIYSQNFAKINKIIKQRWPLKLFSNKIRFILKPQKLNFVTVQVNYNSLEQ
jgi:hypothetical protein